MDQTLEASLSMVIDGILRVLNGYKCSIGLYYESFCDTQPIFQNYMPIAFLNWEKLPLLASECIKQLKNSIDNVAFVYSDKFILFIITAGCTKGYHVNLLG